MAKPEIENLKKTVLYDLHIANGGRMVDFCGYALPIQYSSLVKEHIHTRNSSSLFDVSHMGQIFVNGADFEAKAKLLETLFPADILSLKSGEMRYSVLLNEKAGIIDDLIITRAENGNDVFIVVNGATKENDFAIMKNMLGDKLEFTLNEDLSLIALQGPKSADVLARYTSIANELIFMQSGAAVIAGINVYISRSGYTGEDGFEISVSNDQASKLAKILSDNDEVEFAGLGARDSLRLEAGLCLYGHDMNEEIDPITASIIFAIGKQRRIDGGFVGAKAVQDIIANGVEQKRVGIIFNTRMPVREGAQLIDELGNNIGIITSGSFSPTLEKPIAFGYLPKDIAKIGNSVCAIVRGKQVFGSIVKMPFVKQNYKRSIN